MNWNHDRSSGIWELVENGWHAVVLPESGGMWNGYVEPVGDDGSGRLFCPSFDPEVEHVKAWCMTELARQEAMQKAHSE